MTKYSIFCVFLQAFVGLPGLVKMLGWLALGFRGLGI